MLPLYILINLRNVAIVHLNEFSIMCFLPEPNHHANVYSADYVDFSMALSPKLIDSILIIEHFYRATSTHLS